MKNTYTCFLFAFILVLMSPNKSMGQSFSNTTIRKHGLSLKSFGDPAIFGISYDYFISEQFNTEISLSIVLPGAGISLLHYPIKSQIHKKFRFYYGLHYGHHFFMNQINSFYVPLGFHYLAPMGFQFSLDAGFYHSEIMTAGLFGMKAGYRF